MTASRPGRMELSHTNCAQTADVAACSEIGSGGLEGSTSRKGPAGRFVSTRASSVVELDAEILAVSHEHPQPRTRAVPQQQVARQHEVLQEDKQREAAAQVVPSADELSKIIPPGLWYPQKGAGGVPLTAVDVARLGQNRMLTDDLVDFGLRLVKFGFREMLRLTAISFSQTLARQVAEGKSSFCRSHSYIQSTLLRETVSDHPYCDSDHDSC